MSTKKPDDEKVSNIPPFGLRMLPAMKDRISRAAADNGRSMNAEIVQRIAWSFETAADSLRIELSDELWSAIERDASARNLTPHERATEIVKSAYNDAPELKLHLPPKVKEAIERTAEENSRSINAEIIMRLQDSLFGSSNATIDDVAKIAWSAIGHMARLPNADKMQELEMLYLSIKEREAEERKKFIQLAREVVNSRDEDNS